MAGNSGLTAAEQMSPSFTHPGNYLMCARHWSGDGAGNQIAWLRLHGADSLEREGDLEQVSTDCAKCLSSTAHVCSPCPLTGSLSPRPRPSPDPQCTWSRKGRRTTPGVWRPWPRAGLLSAAAASWTTWTEQPRPKCSLQACLPSVTGINY